MYLLDKCLHFVVMLFELNFVTFVAYSTKWGQNTFPFYIEHLLYEIESILKIFSLMFV